MPDSLRRALRTGAQVSTVEAVIQLLAAFGHDVTTQQHGAIIALATIVVSLAQNAAEDRGTIPAYGKAPASDRANPAT